MKNDYLENRRQAQMNKARGQAYAGVSLFLLFSFNLQRDLFQGAAAAVNPSIGAVAHIAAEMNRNLEEVRGKNPRGKREIIGKPPAVFKKPVITKVIRIDFI